MGFQRDNTVFTSEDPDVDGGLLVPVVILANAPVLLIIRLQIMIELFPGEKCCHSNTPLHKRYGEEFGQLVRTLLF